MAFDGRHKIKDIFEQEVYVVVSQPKRYIPVFDVKSPDGVIKRIHRNHLFPLGFVSDEPAEVGNISVEYKKPENRPEGEETSPKETKAAAGEDSKKRKTVGKEQENRSGDVTEESEEEYVTVTYLAGDAQTLREHMEREVTATKRLVEQPDADDTSIKILEGEPTVIRGVSDADRRESSQTDGKKKVSEETKVKAGTGISHEEDDTDEDVGILEGEAGREEFGDETREVQGCRKSGRVKKKPRRYDDYHMYQMTLKQDGKIQALNKLANTGILDSLNSEIAFKIIEAIMK